MLERYDAIVVGSGAGGGISAYVLTHTGLNVLMLEAGRHYDPVAETPMFGRLADAPLRGSGTPDKAMGFYDATVNGGWSIADEPYVVAGGSEFRWWRARMLGGRTNHWNRICLRFGPYDFKPHSRDGLGFDWPIGYDDVEPWYERVERLIGVTGQAEGLENSPDSAPGVLQPPPALRPAEYFVKRGFESLGNPVAATHAAILTQPLNGRPVLLAGFDWLDEEAHRRWRHGFAEASSAAQAEIMDDIVVGRGAAGAQKAFFGRLRSLMAGAYYTTEVGFQDIGYAGNVALDALPCA